MFIHFPLAFMTAAAGTTFVAEAKTAVRGDVFVVEVRGESDLDPGAVRTKLSSSALYLNLMGTRARSANRAWGEGEATIRAHRHAQYVELEVPLAGARGCDGPVSVTAGEGGSIVATVRCGSVSAKPRAVSRVDVYADEGEDIPRPSKRGLTSRPPARGVPVLAGQAKAEPVIEASVQEELRAAVAPLVPKQEAPKVEAAPPPAPAPKQEAPKVEAPAAATPAAEAKAETPAAAATVEAPRASSGFAVTPVLALLGLGGVGVYLAKRRKRPTRLVQILETTSLGPKRSLIVAKLGGQTLVLGASEAGIAVLKMDGPATAQAAISGALPEGEQVDLGSVGKALDTGEIWPKSDVAADNAAAALAAVEPANDTGAEDDVVVDHAGQASFLAKLFGGRKRKKALSEEWPFDEALEDSFEDQELRAKLAAGMGGKAP